MYTELLDDRSVGFPFLAATPCATAVAWRSADRAANSSPKTVLELIAMHSIKTHQVANRCSYQESWWQCTQYYSFNNDRTLKQGEHELPVTIKPLTEEEQVRELKLKNSEVTFRSPRSQAMAYRCGRRPQYHCSESYLRCLLMYSGSRGLAY